MRKILVNGVIGGSEQNNERILEKRLRMWLRTKLENGNMVSDREKYNKPDILHEDFDGEKNRLKRKVI